MYEFWTNDWQADGKHFIAYINDPATLELNPQDVKQGQVRINGIERKVLDARRFGEKLVIKVTL